MSGAIASGVPDHGRVTLRGYVHQWELDENSHWNGRNYTRAFDRAEAVLAAGGAVVEGPRHIRFLRELRGGELYRIESYALPSPLGPYGVIHLLKGVERGILACLCFSAVRAERLPELPPGALVGLVPRGLAPEPDGPVRTQDLLDSGRAVVTRIDVLRPFDLDAGHRATGRLPPDLVHGLFNEGTPHLWAHIGLAVTELRAQGLGRAMVELRLAPLGRAQAGEAVRMVSWFAMIGEKRAVMRHQLEAVTDGRVLAGLASVALLINLTTRRAAPFPEALRQG